MKTIHIENYARFDLGNAILFTISVGIFLAFIYLFFLLIQALRKYVYSSNKQKDNEMLKKTLGESLKEHRMHCNMTQEFVAEALGVSRQAVSKWENGTTDPSTSNLLALCKLYGIEADELLKNIAK